jgi:uncharacterized protein YjbI with pentapeptide repeats
MESRESSESSPRRFVDEDLRGARFERCDLSGAVVRGSALEGLELDDPWLGRPGASLLVNGVDVAPLVEAELDRRFPGRELRHATSADVLREAWAAVRAAWDVAVARAGALPEGSVDVRVDGEWSFAQTLRHLVMATDAWLRVSLRGVPLDEAFHPWGLPHAEFAEDGFDDSGFTDPPSYDAVLAVRAERVAMVTAFLADLDDADLDAPAVYVWAPDVPRRVVQSVHTILAEEWEHLRYALRDLAVVEDSRSA